MYNITIFDIKNIANKLYHIIDKEEKKKSNLPYTTL